VTAFLLDANVLIALAWPAHEAHTGVQQWFARNSRQGWATCPLTQAAFVRILSNPKFSAHAVTPREALNVLSANLQHSGHQFWRDEIGLLEALKRFEGRVVGHLQVTDAYLLGLALHKNGRLATLDKAVGSLLAEGSPERSRIEIIS
jgi:toxin-antitoxin system PIN domain toxin